MADFKWTEGNRIQVTPPKRPKKITATRFATILGLNPWSTPFEVWCAVTRTYEKPFEDTIYTAAGKAIEPLQIQYMKDSYLMDNLKTPTDIYGDDYFSKTYGDFFGDKPVLGGMWDSLLVNENGEPETVLEFKTTKRSEDWFNDVPEYYALQASLYAWLLGVDDVIMVCSFLSDADYKAPEKFVPNASNTITRSFKVSERYPDFYERTQKAYRWWKEFVETGISPEYDEKKDAEILAELRKNHVDTAGDIAEIIKEAETLQGEIDAHNALIADKEKRLKALSDAIKEMLSSQFREGDKQVVVKGASYEWKYARSETTKVDDKALKKDGLFDKYAVTTTTYRLTKSALKEDK